MAELLDGEIVLRVAIKELTRRTVAGIWIGGGVALILLCVCGGGGNGGGFDEVLESTYKGVVAPLLLYNVVPLWQAGLRPVRIFPGGEDRYLGRC